MILVMAAKLEAFWDDARDVKFSQQPMPDR
jgi:hypothetical protein